MNEWLHNIPMKSRIALSVGVVALLLAVALPGSKEPSVSERTPSGVRAETGDSDLANELGDGLNGENQTGGLVTTHFNPPPAEIPHVTIEAEEDDFMETEDEKARKQEAAGKASRM